MKDVAGWDGYTVRSDRMQIVLQGGHFVIVPADDRPQIERCPCCNLFLNSARAAKLLANRLYPLPAPNEPLPDPAPTPDQDPVT